jgi:hypothetical protein
MNPDVMLTIAFVGEAVLVAIAVLAIIRAQRHPGRDEMGPPPDGGLATGEERSPLTNTPLTVFEKGARGGHV